jgi:transposase
MHPLVVEESPLWSVPMLDSVRALSEIPGAGQPGTVVLAELITIDRRIKTADQELNELIDTTGSTLRELHGIGASTAARLLGDVGDIARFAARGRFPSWNGTAPLDASSGDQNRHRLSRAGNRRINRVLHIMAIVQLRHDTEGRRYYDRKVAAGKTNMEAMRCLKRRLSDIVYAQMRADGKTRDGEPGRAPGGDTSIQRGRLTPRHRHFGSVTSRIRHHQA